MGEKKALWGGSDQNAACTHMKLSQHYINITMCIKKTGTLLPVSTMSCLSSFLRHHPTAGAMCVYTATCGCTS